MHVWNPTTLCTWSTPALTTTIPGSASIDMTRCWRVAQEDNSTELDGLGGGESVHTLLRIVTSIEPTSGSAGDRIWLRGWFLPASAPWRCSFKQYKDPQNNNVYEVPQHVSDPQNPQLTRLAPMQTTARWEHYHAISCEVPFLGVAGSSVRIGAANLHATSQFEVLFEYVTTQPRVFRVREPLRLRSRRFSRSR